MDASKLQDQPKPPQIDWQQVVLNGGPPCFFVEDGKYCGRAERWQGHGVRHFHDFVSLADLLATVRREVWNAAIEIAKAEAFERRMAYCVVEALEASATGKEDGGKV